MNQKDSIARWGVLIAIVIAVVAMFLPILPDGQSAFGAITTGTNFKYGISVGNTSSLGVAPTNIAKILGGTCSLIASSFTVAASTTVPMDCAITGVVSTDLVFGQFATSTQIGQGGWAVRGASASSTAGFITLTVVNSTGASNIIPASIASSSKYIIIGAQ